jgi:hypothetical protein
MNHINVSQDTDQWRALVNTVINLPVPQSLAEQLAASSEGFSFIELDRQTDREIDI